MQHWTPLSGAKFEDVFGPKGNPAHSNSRVRRRRNDRRAKARPNMEALEVRTTPSITAAVIASSLSSTSGSNVTIGEIVRVRVIVQQELSGTYAPSDFNVDATLPAGLQLLPGTVDMALVSDLGMTSTLDPTGTGGLNQVGNDTNINSITPTFLVPPSAITTDPTTGALVFNTGISNVADNDANSEYIVIDYDALVTNVASNQAAPPTTLSSTFQLFVGGQLCGVCQGAVPVTVVEPSITNLTKNVSVNAAGDTATYTLTFSNTGNSVAYDVRVVDNLPAGLTLNAGSVNVVGGTGLTDRSGASTLDLTFDSVAAGASVTITYSTAIPAADRNGQPVTNTVNLDYTSLPGDNGESPNPTGADTPGNSGDVNGERNGNGVGPNVYFDSAQATFSVAAPQPNSLSGFVFGDVDHSGDYSAGDVLFSGITITLVDINGNPVHDINGNLVGPQLTDANGAFSFTNLPDGNYQLLESDANLPAGWMDGLDYAGLINGVQDTNAASDAPPADRIFNIQLSGGETGTNYRFGECPCPPASLSGFVYEDFTRGVFNAPTKNDGLFETPTERGIAGVTVTLTDVNGNPVTDMNGNVVGPTTTDANGFYEFTNLNAGTYRVVETQPPVYQDGKDTPGSTGGNVGPNNGIGTDFITDIPLADGQMSMDNNFGELFEQLSGNVYEDFIRNNFNLPDFNNGLHDPGELGIAGVQLTLYIETLAGNIYVASVTTDANGFYSFTDPGAFSPTSSGPLLVSSGSGIHPLVAPPSLQPGTYTVIETQPAGYLDGKDVAGSSGGTVGPNQGIGSDFIANIPLALAADSTANNFFELPGTSINGFVYLDSNCNGVKETGEPGLPGVQVQLTDMNGNPVHDINGNLVGIATTDANGFYQFLNLPVGTYRVTELPPQPTFNGQPTVQGMNMAGTVNGVTVGTVNGDVINGVALSNGQNSINNDFGECQPGLGGIVLSGHVYYDRNKDCLLDTGDVPVPGVTLHLFRTDAPGGPTEVASTTTNDRGEYLFEPAVAGTYMVTEDNVPNFIKECAQPGTVNGTPVGSAPAVDDLNGIVLVDGDNGINYNFALITNTPPPPPNSKQQLLANQPAGAGVAGATAFNTDPSFANINRTSPITHIMAVGDPGGGPDVRVFNFTTGQQMFNFMAYASSFRGGVRVAVGDVTGDGVPDIVTAPGGGGGPDVRIWDGKTGALVREFYAYDPHFTGGVYVAVGDVNGDGIADIITGAGAGGGPNVRVFDGKTGAMIANFYAYNSGFSGGVRVAAGDFNQDGKADIVTGAGPGGGPHVCIFNSASFGAMGAAPGMITQFFAFDPSFRGGVNVAANAFGGGDLTGDGKTDLVVGTGSGAGVVRVIDGSSFAVVSSFTAFDSSLTKNGVNVGVFDMNGDGRGDVVAGSGGGGTLGAFVRVVDMKTGGDLEFFQAFDPSSLAGAFVAAN
jgi:uncharacterized repeat protein (TIGR01451 family)